jgi:hypothetical protein
MRKALRDSIARAAAAKGKEGRDFLHQVLIAPPGAEREREIREYADALAEKGLAEKGVLAVSGAIDVADLSVGDMFAENPHAVYEIEAPEKEWNDDALADRMLLGIDIRDAVIVLTGTKENVERLLDTYANLKAALPAPVDISRPVTADDIAEEKRERISAEWQDAKTGFTAATAKSIIAPEKASFAVKPKIPA